MVPARAHTCAHTHTLDRTGEAYLHTTSRHIPILNPLPGGYEALNIFEDQLMQNEKEKRKHITTAKCQLLSENIKVYCRRPRWILVATHGFRNRFYLTLHLKLSQVEM